MISRKHLILQSGPNLNALKQSQTRFFFIDIGPEINCVAIYLIENIKLTLCIEMG